jgi:hypothetical protein
VPEITEEEDFPTGTATKLLLEPHPSQELKALFDPLSLLLQDDEGIEPSESLPAFCVPDVTSPESPQAANIRANERIKTNGNRFI